jgi:hypothetical protein
MEMSAEDLQALSPVTLSRIFCITASKASNFGDNASTKSVICASN